MLEWLENWYESQCNGDWEHIFGVRIETIDNPGWSLSIDFEDTGLNFQPKEWILIGDFDNKWIGYKIVENKFDGSCSPKNLNILISIFMRLVEGVEINSNEILSSLR